MEIGREALSDTDFNMHWTTLYQEFYKLDSRGECNASTVYNSIYIICTSTVPYEDKLYWKIGDFLYNRCKEHKRRIEEANDYVGAYATCFERYEKMVRSMNRLCSFLNGCVRGRKINEFGYLLWERSVLQSMPKHFFEDVYSYKEEGEQGCERAGLTSYMGESPARRVGSRVVSPSRGIHRGAGVPVPELLRSSEEEGDEKGTGGRSVRMVVLRSLALIVPDPTDPLLFYKEQYEKMALFKIEEKYGFVRSIKDIVPFATVVHNVVTEARGLFPYYFLAQSADSLERALSDAIFREEVEIIAAIRLLICRTTPLPGMSTAPHGRIEQDEGHVVNKAEMMQNLRAVFDKPIKSMRGIGKGTTTCHSVINNLTILDKGYALTKMAYAEYIIDTINTNMGLFGTSIGNICSLYHAMDIFSSYSSGDTNIVEEVAPAEGSSGDKRLRQLFSASSDIGSDYEMIIVSVFKYALQRIRPCFIARLCDFSSRLVGHEEASEAEEAVFYTMARLVADRREFINVYHTMLRRRLVMRCSVMEKERGLLNGLGISSDDRLSKMIEEIEMSRQVPPRDGNVLTLLNSNYWGIEGDGSAIGIPDTLLESIVRSYGGVGRDGKYKNDGRVISVMPDVSRITVQLGQGILVVNISQYAVLEALKVPASFDEIRERSGLQGHILREILGILSKEGIIGHRTVPGRRDSWIFLRDIGAHQIDISEIVHEPEPGADFCPMSYAQALLTRILKKRRKLSQNELIGEFMRLTGNEMQGERLEEALNALLEKEIAERTGEIVEYVT